MRTPRTWTRSRADASSADRSPWARRAMAGRLDVREVLADGREVGPGGVRIQGVRLLQGVVGGAREEFVEVVEFGGALGDDPPPLLVHVVVPLHEILDVAAVRPRGVRVLDVEPVFLAELPPAVRPLEGEPADRVADHALPGRLLVDLAPLSDQVPGLGGLVLAHVPRVPRVRAELGEHHGPVEDIAYLLEQLSEGDPPVHVGAEDVHIGDLFGDDVEVLEVAVGHRHRTRRVDLLDASAPPRPKSEYMWRARTALASPSGRSSVSAELHTSP